MWTMNTSGTPGRARLALRAAVAACLCVLPLGADSASTVQTVTVSISPSAKLSVPSSAGLTPGGTAFSPYAASTAVSYRARTSVGGSATATLQAASDFAPSGGPSLGTNDLKYTCTAATMGSACSGTQTVSASSQSAVVVIPGGVCMGSASGCSTPDPASLNVQFQLENSPASQTGAYAVQITFTVSSL